MSRYDRPSVRRLAANESSWEEVDGVDDTVGGLGNSNPGSKKIDMGDAAADDDDDDDDEEEEEHEDEDEHVIKDGVVDEARINKELLGVENDDDDDMIEEDERLACGDANGDGTEDSWDLTLLRMAAGIMKAADKGGRQCDVSCDGEIIVVRRGIDGGSDGKGGGAGRRESESEAKRASSRGALRFASPAVQDCTVGLTIASCESSVW
jgi:hypothetical protein